jgi:cyclic pyranopterin phosphate synthase
VLYDNHNRPLTYLRLAVTDRCNLRCTYCMPATGMNFLPKGELLTFEEMARLVRLLAQMGITKVRITGGEPFVRKELMQLLHRILLTPGIAELHLTTNGLLLAPHLAELKQLGIASINLSLDSLSRERFKKITHVDAFEQTWRTVEQIVALEIPLKINTVVMAGKNIDDLVPMAALTQTWPVSVRFIEEMPFNGVGAAASGQHWHYQKILAHLQERWPGIKKTADDVHATAYHYQLPGAKGYIGIIAAFSRTFCGTCNRLRITAQGQLKTCLYDAGVLDLKTLMRQGAADEELVHHLLHAFRHRPKDGFEAEAARPQPILESMSAIGG